MKLAILTEIQQLVLRATTEGQIDKPIEDHLKKENEGCVFVHVFSIINGRDLMTSKRYYIVQEGKVHELYNGKIASETGDSVFCLTAQCIKIGKYNPKNTYQQKTFSCGYSDFVKRNNLK